METASATTPRMIALARLLLTLTVALLLGAMLTQGVDATHKKPHKEPKPSIEKRTGNQKDLCTVDGGTFGSHETAFGTTITSCSGGSEGDWSCVNSKTKTTCEGLRTQPPSGGVVAPTPGGAGTAPDGNSGTPPDGSVAPPSGGVSG